MTDLDSPHSWRLKGQGNANAVFAYTGNCQWLVGVVLRVRKIVQNADTEAVVVPLVERLESRVWSPLISQSVYGAVERQTAYEETVLQHLLAAQYIHTGIRCQLSTDFAAELSAQLQSADRSLSCKAWLLPDHTVFRQRADGTRLCTDSSGRGLEGKGADRNNLAGELSTDLYHAGTLCVEIKPKCGFLPTSACIRPEHEVKTRVSRFQLHQQLKLAQGKIKHLSRYNPLDFFSGEPQRVEAALAALFLQPQNNLRLFLDGSPMQLPQDDRLPSLQRLSVVQQAGDLQGLIRLLRLILLKEGVLDRILKVQKLDVHDVEGIHPLLAALLLRHAPASLSNDTPQRRQEAPCASTETHPTSPSGHKAPVGNPSGEHDAALERLLSADFGTAADALRGYLTAATAKDCSLMITLAPCLSGFAPSGDSRPDRSDAAELCNPGVNYCAETSRREVSESAAGVPRRVGELDSCGNDQFAKRNSKEVAAGIAQAAARPLSVGQGWASSNEHAVGGIMGTSTTGNEEEWLPSQQEDPDMGSIVQHGQTGTWWRYKIAVVDLDLKPLSKVEQHFRLDQQILDTVLKTSSSTVPGIG